MKNQIKMSVMMLAVFAPVFMNAQDVYWAQADDSLALELIAMEKMWAESNCMDQPGLENVFADEFQGTSPFGIYYGKKEAIATDWNNLRKECILGDVKIRFFGETLAIAYGSESSILKNTDGKEIKRCQVWTDTWLKRDGKWQIIAAHDAIVTCPN